MIASECDGRQDCLPYPRLPSSSPAKRAEVAETRSVEVGGGSPCLQLSKNVASQGLCLLRKHAPSVSATPRPATQRFRSHSRAPISSVERLRQHSRTRQDCLPYPRLPSSTKPIRNSHERKNGEALLLCTTRLCLKLRLNQFSNFCQKLCAGELHCRKTTARWETSRVAAPRCFFASSLPLA